MIPLAQYRQLCEAYRRGDAATVLGQAEHVIHQLESDPAQAGLVPAVLVMVGASFAGQERYADALAYLQRGLELLPGTASTRELGTGDPFALIELDLLLLVGRFREVWEIVQQLTEPGRSLETRLGATRAQIALSGHVRGLRHGPSAAEHRGRIWPSSSAAASRRWSSTATGPSCSRLQGRTVEATAFADQVVPMLVAPGSRSPVGVGPVTGRHRRHHRGPPHRGRGRHPHR